MASALQERNYWRRFLLPGERLVHVFGVSRTYIFMFWWLPVGLLFVIGAGTAAAGVPALGLLLILALLGAVLPPLYLTFFVHYAITDRRVMTREGLLHKEFVAVDLPSITDISIKERLLERLFTRSGRVLVNTAGSSRVELQLQHVAHPFDRRQDIFRHQQEAAALMGRPTGIAPTGNHHA